MEIKLEIGTRGAREEFEETYTRSFLEDNGLTKLESDVPFSWSTPYAVHTKFGWMCSFSKYDLLTYMGHEIWDLKVYKSNKDKEV